jgi:hypothetical protein
MSLGTGLEEAISVDMDGEWKSTTPPDWLVTEGVASCIAIAIACNAPPRAWLVHAPNFGSDDSKLSKLREMLFDAASVRPLGNGLQIWVTGGVAAQGCEEEGTLAQLAVLRLINEIAPCAVIVNEWSEADRVELIFKEEEWCCPITRTNVESWPELDAL